MATPSLVSHHRFISSSFLPLCWERRKKRQNETIPVRLSIDVIRNLPLKNFQEKNISYIQLRLSTFDIAHKQFYGRTLFTSKISVHTTLKASLKINCNQVAYLKSSFHDADILICIEVVGIRQNETEIHNEPKQISLGWTFFRIFEHLFDAKQRRKLDVAIHDYHAVLYHGSPRALLFMEDSIEKNPFLQRVSSDSYISCSVSMHKVLRKVQHLIPDDILMNGNELVPGLEEGPINPSMKVPDYFLKPKPKKSTPLFIDHLKVILCPNVRSFEEQMCENLTANELDSGSQCTVVERRLKVGVHNGFCYLQAPTIVHLSVEEDSSLSEFNLSRNTTVHNDGKVDSDTVLSHGNTINLVEMLEDVHLVVVFLLEYVVSVVPYKRTVTPTRFQHNLIAVRLGIWKPYLSETHSDSVARVQLHSGPLQNPDSVLIYGNIVGDIASEVIFTFSLEKQRSISRPNLVSPSSLRTNANSERRRQIVSAENDERTETPSTSSSLTKTPPTSSKLPIQKIPTTKPRTLPKNSRELHPELNKRSSDEQFLQEVPSDVGPHLAVVATHARMLQGARALSRASYARLYASDLPLIFDRNGKPPEIVDPLDSYVFLPAREDHDILKSNVLVFQFLAFSRCGHVFAHPQYIFFTFQFYRFPPFVSHRLLLGKMDTELSCEPTYLLERTDADTSNRKGTTGFEVRYCIDPSSDDFGGTSSFARNLNEMHLHIDVWDGDSMMFIGSTSVELKLLCRQEREAVQVTYELDVRYAEHGDDETKGDIVTRGRLHLRMANIGFPFSPDKQQHDCVSLQYVASAATAVVRLSSSFKNEEEKVCRVRSLLDARHGEMTQFSDGYLEETENKPSVSLRERQRKLSRMQAIRNAQCDNTYIPTTNLRNEKAVNLKIIEELREKTKLETIKNILIDSVGVHHTIRPVIGSAEYFEFELVNPSKTEDTISIECENEDLRVITDAKEWLMFRKLLMANSYEGQLPTIEQNMFITDKTTGWQRIFLRAREKVFVSFRYQSFKVEHSIEYNLENVSHLHQETDQFMRKTSKCETNLIKVYFKGSSGKLIHVLCLHVYPQPPLVDQTFRFQHSENAYFKRFLRVLPRETDAAEVYRSVSSDETVITEIRQSNSSLEPIDVLLKVSCGKSGSMRSFYVFLYDDVYHTRPFRTWKVSVHALQRIDVNCEIGQMTKQLIVLRGMQSTRLVQCYTSQPVDVQLNPSNPFLLAAGAVHELRLMIKSLQSGKRFICLNVVDVELRQLVHCFLVCVTCRPPIVSRTFQVKLPLGGGHGSNKRISYTNSMSHKRVFCLVTNRPDLLQFRETTFEVSSRKSHTIGLVFTPQMKHGVHDILVFINGEESKNEETFCIKVTYV